MTGKLDWVIALLMAILMLTTFTAIFVVVTNSHTDAVVQDESINVDMIVFDNPDDVFGSRAGGMSLSCQRCKCTCKCKGTGANRECSCNVCNCVRCKETPSPVKSDTPRNTKLPRPSMTPPPTWTIDVPTITSTLIPYPIETPTSQQTTYP